MEQRRLGARALGSSEIGCAPALRGRAATDGCDRDRVDQRNLGGGDCIRRQPIDETAPTYSASSRVASGCTFGSRGASPSYRAGAMLAMIVHPQVRSGKFGSPHRDRVRLNKMRRVARGRHHAAPAGSAGEVVRSSRIR